MVFDATFNNISVISWRSVLLVEETGVVGENHRPFFFFFNQWALSRWGWLFVFFFFYYCKIGDHRCLNFFFILKDFYICLIEEKKMFSAVWRSKTMKNACTTYTHIEVTHHVIGEFLFYLKDVSW